MNQQETSCEATQVVMPKRAGEFVTLRGGGYSPSEMFDSFWREGELALMFGAAGVGKSLLAVQVADALAGPSPIEGFRMSRSRYKVLYVDLRHSDRQFAERYCYWVEHRRLGHVRQTCKFAKNLHRSRPPAGAELYPWLSKQIAQFGFNAVVVDDLTALKKTHDGVREMLAAMRGLKRLCDELRVSVLAIAGSEEPASSRQVSERDMKRASVLCDVADTVFAIGRTRGDGRFILQTRSRNAPLEWAEHNAPSARIAQTAKGGPGFVFDKKFKEPVDPEVREACCRIRAMRQAGQTWRVIESELGIPKTRAVRLFKKWTPDMGELASEKAGSPPYKGGVDAASADGVVLTTPGEVQPEMNMRSVVENHRVSGTKNTPLPPLLCKEGSPSLPAPPQAYGPNRVALHDLKRGLDRGGEEIFIESEEEHTRQPKIWYKRDRRGDVSRFVRNGWGSTAFHLGASAFL